jgi:hypothetical protein
VTGASQEALVVNQVRLLRNPGLIDALYANPELTADSRRMLNEFREEFFDKETRRQEARRHETAAPLRPEPELEPEAASPSGVDSFDRDEGEQSGEPPTSPAGSGAAATDPVEAARGAEEIYLGIMRMSVPERVKLALRGSKEERRFLIADGSRMVSLAVLRSRGLTLTEVESFCAMRYLDDEVFYQITRKRDWIRRQRIMLTLVRNPKVPLAITMPLIPRLPLRELRNIARDRNLPEAIRTIAGKTYLKKRK